MKRTVMVSHEATAEILHATLYTADGFLEVSGYDDTVVLSIDRVHGPEEAKRLLREYLNVLGQSVADRLEILTEAEPCS